MVVRHVAVTGLQDGVGVQVEGEVERMAELLLSHSVSLGGMGGAQSQCVTTELPLSLFLSLSPSSLTSWSRQCVSQASVLHLQLRWRGTKTEIRNKKRLLLFISVQKEMRLTSFLETTLSPDMLYCRTIISLNSCIVM